MNWNCPPNYIEPSVKESVDTTLALFEYIGELPKATCGEPLLHPILTPRFAISCTEELLTRLSEIARKNPKLAIQTHISENKAEVELTKSLFKTNSYAEAYDKFHLLRNNTVLAHGVHLTEDEMVLIAKRGSGVAHCPTSNFYLSSGMARVGLLLDHGVKVGLGTDVAGGYSPSILTEIQHASIASKMLAIQAADNKKCKCSGGRSESSSSGEEDSHSRSRGREHHECQCDCECDEKQSGRFTNQKLSIATLLYLATLGGAGVCCLQDRIGSFEQTKAFDALLVSVREADTGNPAVWGYNPGRDLTEGVTAQNANKSLIEWLERFLFCGDDRNIKKVIVQGRTIGGRDYHPFK
jgi:guanine deaminase